MKNPSAFGVSLLVLVAATLLVGPSSANNDPPFHSANKSLSAIIANTSLKEIVRSYQQQINTISLDRANLTEPHWLTVSVPAGTTLQAQVVINGDTRLTLNNTTEHINLSPYLEGDKTVVTISGTYTPVAGAISVKFEGPGTVVQQQTGNTGRIDYQLNLVVE